MALRDWYCQDVLSGKLETEVVRVDAQVLAFHHPKPQAEIHVVIISKKHIASMKSRYSIEEEILEDTACRHARWQTHRL